MCYKWVLQRQKCVTNAIPSGKNRLARRNTLVPVLISVKKVYMGLFRSEFMKNVVKLY